MAKPLVVITGATHGIGKALADAFAAEGHRLLLIARHPEPLEGVTAELATQAAVDVADYAALEQRSVPPRRSMVPPNASWTMPASSRSVRYRSATLQGCRTRSTCC
jgi:NAD(P)-dependent dehydrogenase (short-subunit alcohol dehydrogenase family)